MNEAHYVCLAVVWGVFLLCSKFVRYQIILRTDQHALQTTFNVADSTVKLVCWCWILFIYDLELLNPVNLRTKQASLYVYCVALV